MIRDSEGSMNNRNKLRTPLVNSIHNNSRGNMFTSLTRNPIYETRFSISVFFCLVPTFGVGRLSS